MRNVTWTGLTWGEYEKVNMENYFYKTVVEAKCLINVHRPNTQHEHAVEVSNANNELHSGRGIRDGPLW